MRGIALGAILVVILAIPTTRPIGAAEAPVTESRPSGLDRAALAAFLDSVIPGLLKSTEIPGAVVVAVQSGEVIVRRGYGLADIPTQRRMDPATTVVRIASVSKMITAMLALQLVHSGQVALDARVAPLLGPVRLHNSFRQPVTLRRLLTHTAGIDKRDIGRLTREGTTPPGLEDYLEKNTPPVVRPPGDVLAYSNHGYALVGEIVATSRRSSFEEAARRYVFEPLSMHSSSFAITDSLKARMATGYRAREGRFERVPLDHVNTIPASTMVTTGDDFARLLSWMLTPEEGASVLDAGHREAMRRVQFRNHAALSSGYGYGLFVQEGVSGCDWVYHDGDMDGASAEMDIYPCAAFGLFMAFNTQDGGVVADVVREALQNRFLNYRRRPLVTAASFKHANPERLRGRWVYVNEPESSLGRIARLFDEGSPIEVVGRDTLRFEGHSYTEVAPLVYRCCDDSLRVLAFMQGRTGQHYATTGIRAFRRLRGYEDPRLHRVILVLSVLGLLTVAIRTWTLVRRRGRLAARGGYARRWTLASAVLFVFGVFLAAFVSIAPNAPLRYGVPASLRLTLSLAAFGVVLSGLMPVVAFLDEKDVPLRGLERWHYALVTACALAFSFELFFWGQIG